MENFDTLKYKELRKLAKKVGIKANHMKTDTLIKALHDYNCKEQKKAETEDTDLKTKAINESENSSRTESSSNDCMSDEKSNKKAARCGGKKAKRGAKKKATKSNPLDNDKVELKKTTTTLSGEAKTITPVRIRSHSLNNTPKYAGTLSGRLLNLNNKPKRLEVLAHVAREPLGAGSRRSYTPKTVGRLSVTSKPRLSTSSQSGKKQDGVRPSSFLTPKEIIKRRSASAVTLNTAHTASHSTQKPVLAPIPDHPISTRRRSSQSVTEVSKPVPEKRCSAGDGPVTRHSKSRSATPVQDMENCAPDSADTQSLISVMKSDMTNIEMKESLIVALDKKVKDQIKNDPQKTSIPRFAAFLAKKKEHEKSTKGTPDHDEFDGFTAEEVLEANRKGADVQKHENDLLDFSFSDSSSVSMEENRDDSESDDDASLHDWHKIHKKQFDKFDSLDVYLSKKRKRADDITASVKKARMMLEEVNAVVNKLKSHETPTQKKPSSSSFKSPAVNGSNKMPNAFKPTVTTKHINLNFASTKTTLAASQTKPAITKAPFKPTITSTKDIKLNFSTLKTPTTLGTNKTPRGSGNRRSTGSCQPKLSVGTTPFRFNASMNTSLNMSVSKKPMFDLRASLARPTTWKTHKGKLKSFDYNNSSEYVKPSIKTPITQTREQRRLVAMKQRADKKFSAQMARRGISAL